MPQLQTVTTSKKGTLNLNDFWKGFLIAVLSPIFTILITSLNAGSLTFDWKAIGGVALAAMLSYLMKNLLSQSKIVVSGASDAVVKSVKEGDTDVKVGATTAKIVENVPPNNP